MIINKLRKTEREKGRRKEKPSKGRVCSLGCRRKSQRSGNATKRKLNTSDAR
jgi:hypothetical protein